MESLHEPVFQPGTAEYASPKPFVSRFVSFESSCWVLQAPMMGSVIAAYLPVG